jgi:hypothetical protein
MARVRRGPNQKHGKSNTPEYKVWVAMLHRCENKDVPMYKHYGGRGIKVCDRWHDFLSFYEDMGERPKGLTLDRIDNDGDYTPENCRWATQQQQCTNKRNNRRIKYKGETKTMSQWADHLGVSRSAFQSRVYAGWPVEKIFKTPFEKFTTIRALIDHYSND